MLLTVQEAAALLERKHGKGVHRSTILRWSRAGHFPVVYRNGWKVHQQPFLVWAERAGKLKGVKQC